VDKERRRGRKRGMRATKEGEEDGRDGK